MNYLKSILPFIFLSFPSAWATCDVDNISYVRTTGFSLSFGSNDSGPVLDFSGGVSSVINIPMRFVNKRGCFKQSSALDFEIKQKNYNRKGSLNIYAPKVEFKNIPGRLMSYILITSNVESNREASVDDINFELANIMCLGEEVLSVHGFSGNISKMNMYHEAVTPKQITSSRHFIATGQAAINLRKSLSINNSNKYSNGLRNLPIGLAKIFSEKVGDEYMSVLSTEQTYFVPKIFASSSIDILGTSVSDVFETQVGTHAACSKKFESTMKKYRFKSFKAKTSGISLKAKLKKSSGRQYLNIKWKN